MSKRMIVSVLLLAIGLVGWVLVLAIQSEQPAAASESRQQPTAKDSKVNDLLKERLATLSELVKATTAEYLAGKAPFDRLHQAQRALLNAQLEQCDSDKERIKVLEEMVALLKESEKNAVQRYKTGAATQSDALMATAARLDAEIALERSKSKAHP